MIKTAKFIKKLSNFRGDARLYEVNPPVNFNEDYDTGEYKQSTSYVVVSAAIAPFSGPETYIFPADKTGKIIDWLELNGSYQGGLDHKLALTNAGYEIIE